MTSQEFADMCEQYPNPAICDRAKYGHGDEYCTGGMLSLYRGYHTRFPSDSFLASIIRTELGPDMSINEAIALATAIIDSNDNGDMVNARRLLKEVIVVNTTE